jgi:AbrB family looped-hinge helix DNA binding protein
MYPVRSKMTSKGQVTLPKSLRTALSLREGDNVLFSIEENGRAVLCKQAAPGASAGCGHRFVAGKNLAPASRADIDAAIAAAMARRVDTVYHQDDPENGGEAGKMVAQ